MRKHIQRTLPRTWIKKGFLPEEAYFLSELTRAGAQAPYIQAMSRHRSSLNANRVRYGWSKAEYRRRVVADYKKLGVTPFKGGSYAQYLKKHFYDLFTIYKDKTPATEYISPRKKRRVRPAGETKAQATRRKMLIDKIAQLNIKINRAIMNNNQVERKRLETQRNNYQNQLDRLE